MRTNLDNRVLAALNWFATRSVPAHIPSPLLPIIDLEADKAVPDPGFFALQVAAFILGFSSSKYTGFRTFCLYSSFAVNMDNLVLGSVMRLREEVSAISLPETFPQDMEYYERKYVMYHVNEERAEYE
ncbi:MAG TPA: hypothetical protein VH164_10675 [Ktedonobacteraceae bacterium]|nr:hypothetical protein [Ktedonobacteraceae bacterium]